jgi:hypothetical protein
MNQASTFADLNNACACLFGLKLFKVTLSVDQFALVTAHDLFVFFQVGTMLFTIKFCGGVLYQLHFYPQFLRRLIQIHIGRYLTSTESKLVIRLIFCWWHVMRYFPIPK